MIKSNDFELSNLVVVIDNSLFKLRDIIVDIIYWNQILETKIYIALILISLNILNNIFYKTVLILQLLHKI